MKKESFKDRRFAEIVAGFPDETRKDLLKFLMVSQRRVPRKTDSIDHLLTGLALAHARRTLAN
jgi:hypothetical protein